MFCPHCGAADQKGQFCGACGTRIPALDAGAERPSINHSTNVVVNVGAPTIIDARGRRAHPIPATVRDDSDGLLHNPAFITFALIFFWPLGMVLLWMTAPWRTNTKWAITGLFCWPLWGVLAQRAGWPRLPVVALVAALILGYVAVLSGHAIGLLVGIPALIWAVWFARRPEPSVNTESDPWVEVQRDVQACDALIAEIESTIALQLLDSSSPTLLRYRNSLAQREVGSTILSERRSPENLPLARSQVDTALQGLHAVRDELV